MNNNSANTSPAIVRLFLLNSFVLSSRSAGCRTLGQREKPLNNFGYRYHNNRSDGNRNQRFLIHSKENLPSS
jgi:hypothetical protein